MAKHAAKRRRQPAVRAAEKGGLDRLGAVVERRARLDDEMRGCVVLARKGGATWAEIGQVLGVTGAGARQRWQPELSDGLRTIHRALRVGGEAAGTRRSAGREADAS
jgi:hypothetical protein